MPLAGAHESWWIASTKQTSYPPLPDGVEADVVVLGSGIAGITTAYALALEGRDVVLLDAGRVAEGVTGHTTAKVSVGHNLVYADLADRFDAATAEGYARSQSEALQWLCDTVEREQINCELERLPSLVYTESADEREKVEAEVEAATTAGLPATLVTDVPLPYDVIAGVRLEDQAQFHPRRYLLALVERIVELGGRVYEQTRAVDVESGSPCIVRTDRGTVRATEVVVATHYPFLDRGLLFARLAQYRDAVVAFPVDAERAPKVMAISTGSEDGGTHSVRTAPYRDGKRLLIVTGGQYKTGTTTDVESAYEDIASWARDRFDVGEPAFRWSTQDASSVDRLPYVGRLPLSGDHIWVATGFSAWGMTGGTMSAMILTDLLQGRNNPWAELYDPSRIDPRAAGSKFLTENLEVAKELVKGKLHTDISGPDELSPGEAGIYRRGVGLCAAFRDQDGVVHAVKAACTHLGCTVRFNDAERSWDCPCHGSRFGLDGSVLHGPAVKPLEQVET
jgi:glycine/D-amino acid oxidase-like deaminating enzyme/nitrite reductase/ring-hydroxylating ferredoxin subunit